jgi:DNA-directed RNA polymerase subunit beta'
MAYQQSELDLHTFVWVKCEDDIDSTSEIFFETKIGEIVHLTSPYLQIKKDVDGTILTRYMRTTPGRILLNESFK